MHDKRTSQVSLNAIRLLFLSAFGALLILELCLAFLALRYNSIQNGIIADQGFLLRTREILSDALRDADASWKSVHDTNFIKSQEPENLPESAVKASESIKILRKLQRPSLVFPSSDLDRLEDILANNIKLLNATPPFTENQRNLQDKTVVGFNSFISAIDIRLFSSMQEFRREVEYLEMVIWGLVPLLILSTIVFGGILFSKVMQPLTQLKKQARKLIENVAVLQNELRIAQAEAAANATTAESLSKLPHPRIDAVPEVQTAPAPPELAQPIDAPSPMPPPMVVVDSSPLRTL